VEIKQDNIFIRSASIEDAEILTKWWNDGSVMAHAGFPLGLNTTIEKTITQILENEHKISQRCIILIDFIKVGELNYNIIDHTAEIGIKICDATYQNQGYGKKILKMLISFLFDEISVEKIILDTNLKNLRAQNTYLKLGFRKLRTNIDAWKDQLGNLQSSVDFEMTKTDYLKRGENQQ
jgi:RimJ/RimL family protein N-acetyltransferase